MKTEITLLQQEMKKQGIAMYLVPTSDEHLSEYIPEMYQFRAYLSGFTGSAGTLLVTEDKCLLWTDGRYFIQAEKELENSEIILMRSGEKNVETIEEYISKYIKKGQKLGANAALISMGLGQRLENLLHDKECILADIDLAELIWKDRPAIAVNRIDRLALFFTGRRVQEKLEMIREKMKEQGAAVHIISSLDDIAWTFNLRGHDIPYNPVFYSYAVITLDKALLFVKYHTINEKLLEMLADEKVEVCDYFKFYEYLNSAISDEFVLLDNYKTNYRIWNFICKKNHVICNDNPSALIKMVKTTVEAANIREVHVQDGLAMTKFIYWVKKQVEDGCDITECDAAKYIDNKRSEIKDFVDLSFDTIAAYGENAAMCHYSPNKEHPVTLEPKGFLLVDCGGQFTRGTTDVTRTIALGELLKKQKEHYTLVLQGHIRLSMARFPKGVCGANLDILARGALWRNGLDYNHGTGHGVGSYLSVHEGPVSIHWNLQRSTAKTIPLTPGMLFSNEPGVYLEGQYGIRIENLLLVKETEEYGMRGYLEFENMTMAPYETDAILVDMLSDEELAWLNEYHRHLFEIYAKNMNDEERDWLRKVTVPLLKETKECYNQDTMEE